MLEGFFVELCTLFVEIAAGSGGKSKTNDNLICSSFFKREAVRMIKKH